MQSLYIFILSFILPFIIKGFPLIKSRPNQDEGRKILIPIILLPLDRTLSLEQSEGDVIQQEQQQSYSNSSSVNITLNLISSVLPSPTFDLELKWKEFEILLVILKPNTKDETPQHKQKERTVGITHWKNILESSIENLQGAFLSPQRGDDGDGETKKWEAFPENLKNDTIEWIKKFQEGQVEKYGDLINQFSSSSNVQNLVPSSILLRPSQQQHEMFMQKPTAEIEKLGEYAEQFVEALNGLTIKLPFDYLVQRFKDLNLTLDFGAKDKIHQKLLELTFGEKKEEQQKNEDISKNHGEKHSFITISGNGNANGNGFTASSGRPSLPIPNNTIIIPGNPKPTPASLLQLLSPLASSSPPSNPNPNPARPFILSHSRPIITPKPTPVPKPLPKPTPLYLSIPIPTTNKPLNNNNHNYSPPYQQQNNQNSNPAPSISGSSLSTNTEADKFIPFPFTTAAPTMPNWSFDSDEINFYPDKYNNGNDHDPNSHSNPGSGGGIFNLNFNLIKLNLNFNFQYQQPSTPPFLTSPFVLKPKPSKRPIANSHREELLNENGDDYDT